MALKAEADNWRNNRKRREEGRAFDLSTNCLFCFTSFHSKVEYRRIRKQSTVDSIIAQLEAYGKTQQNRTISARICQLRNKNDSYYTNNDLCHHAHCMARFFKFQTHNVRGRPITEDMTNLLSFIINCILQNSEECQFSLKSILEAYKNEHGETEISRLDRIEKYLKDHSSTSDRFIFFKQTLGKCIEDSWYNNRISNSTEEKLRIVELASHVILQDIRSAKFNTSEYNSPNNFLNTVKEDIPETFIFRNSYYKDA